MQFLNSQTRGLFYQFVLNPLCTKIFDSFSPVGSVGAAGERLAERFLLKRGWVIVHKGYEDNFGEIDLIAVENNNTIVFVEVKTRTSDIAGRPDEAVDEIKQEKITKTAVSYLKRFDLLDCRVRFDVIAVYWQQNGKNSKIDHFEDAFSAVGENW